jgi:hypothetical protein
MLGVLSLSLKKKMFFKFKRRKKANVFSKEIQIQFRHRDKTNKEYKIYTHKFLTELFFLILF